MCLSNTGSSSGGKHWFHIVMFVGGKNEIKQKLRTYQPLPFINSCINV
jgi:hypothetical protein